MTNKASLLILLMFWVFIIDFGRLHGRVFPSSAPAFNVTAVSSGENSLISGSSIKYNETCSPLRMDWRKGVRGERSAPIDIIWNKVIVRDEGAFDFENWKALSVVPNTILENSYADVLHECTVAGITLPYEVRTRFWQ